MVNAVIVVFTAAIAYNTIFQFFTVHADFLLKWRNQIYICRRNASSATAVVSTGEKIKQFSNLMLDALKIELLDTLKVNSPLNAFKVISIC